MRAERGGVTDYRLMRGASKARWLSGAALALLINLAWLCACSGPKPSDRKEISSASAASHADVFDAAEKELKDSKFCSDAAEKFWNRHDWKDNTDLRLITTYTSHYSKALNKCLVDVHGANTYIKGKVMETDHIYDALENKVFAAQLLTKKGADADAEVEKMLLIKDGRMVRSKEEVDSFIPWFKSLMTQ